MQPEIKRIYLTFLGHFHELMAVFVRSAAHKLPGAKGRLRERAVVDFLSTWLPKRYTVPTNVFASSTSGRPLDIELDFVIHDSLEGAVWPIDGDAENTVATWEQVKLVGEIKSRLGEAAFSAACASMKKVTDFSEANGHRPLRVVFAFEVEEDFEDQLLEKFTYQHGDAFPFDAVILLSGGAFVSDRLTELRIGFNRGLAPNLVQHDGPSQDILTIEFGTETRIPHGLRHMGDGTASDTLLAFAAIATFAAAGNNATQALLSACKMVDHHRIFEGNDVPDGEPDVA